jgi:hypothetical protein
MKHRVKWGISPAPGRASDRKGLSCACGLSGRTTRGRATETEGVSQMCRKRAETCGNVSQTCRVCSVHYTTARAFPRLCLLPQPTCVRGIAPRRTWAVLLAPGGRRLPASGATYSTWRPCWPSSPGWPCCPTRPGTAPRGACVRQRAAFCRALAASARAPAPAFAVSSGMPLRKKPKLAKGRRWGRMRPPDRGR